MITTYSPFINEDLSPEHAKRMLSYYEIVDRVVDELKKRGELDPKCFKSTPKATGYARFGEMQGLGLGFELQFECWAQFADTPFWIFTKKINRDSWVAPLELKNACGNLPGHKAYEYYDVLYFPLFPLLDKTEDLVINDLANQVVSIVGAVNKEMKVEKE